MESLFLGGVSAENCRRRGVWETKLGRWLPPDRDWATRVKDLNRFMRLWPSQLPEFWGRERERVATLSHLSQPPLSGIYVLLGDCLSFNNTVLATYKIALTNV